MVHTNRGSEPTDEQANNKDYKEEFFRMVWCQQQWAKQKIKMQHRPRHDGCKQFSEDERKLHAKIHYILEESFSG